MRKKVLIVGNSAKEYALAKIMSKTCDVYVAPGNDGMKEFAVCVDIRETSSQELLEFVLENGIDMTIPVSSAALETNITEMFTKNNMQIFAPDRAVVKLLFDKFNAKKNMYKLNIPTPKFGIFEKQAVAWDYIKGLKKPFVIKNNSSSSAVIFASPNASKRVLDSMFAEKDSKILVEDYVYGVPFGFYTATDGYKALPIGSSILYKHSLDGNGGQLTSGMGACSPNYKLSVSDEDFLMNDIIYKTLDYLEINKVNYVGVLGINGILSENGNIYILGYQSFMQDSDCAGILELLDIDIYTLFESCILGSFSDEINYVPQKNLSSASVFLHCRNGINTKENVIKNIDNLDDDIVVTYTNNVHKNKYLEMEANPGPVVSLTAFGGVPASPVKKVYDEVCNINFNGIKYRRDIGKFIECETYS